MKQQNMNQLTYLSSAPEDKVLPQGFPSPFSNIPHPLAVEAALALQARLKSVCCWQHDFQAPGGGKMFGVLVVCDREGRYGYLAAFSGMVAGEWEQPGFVPPLFEQAALDAFLPTGEAQLKRYGVEIADLSESAEFAAVRAQLAQMQQQREAEIAQLKRDHRGRKKMRQALRESGLSADPVVRENELMRLSFESQQDRRARRELALSWAEKLKVVEQKCAHFEAQIAALRKVQARLSNRLQRRVFECYRLTNRSGEQKNVADFFAGALPPAGSGDCAAPKLLQYAFQRELNPLALAEFWWGASPQAEVRHHGHFYPACRGKCHPLLPFMLEGLDVQPRVLTGRVELSSTLEIVYEDAELLVINKPSGLLSVPGRAGADSVFARLREGYPEASGPLLVHRLDMSTSGLLLAAKNSATHRALQHQFEARTIEKRYVAELSKRLPQGCDSGTIELPLRVDVEDRPRQLVCHNHGKAAVTHWRVVSRGAHTTRVYFYPHTGRTHQLRLHAAHSTGLDAPIVGDELYGQAAQRLLLHAERLCFRHPASGQQIELHAALPF